MDGKPFCLERNFYHREKQELLRNEADGEELSVVYGDLQMLLGGVTRETFLNTWDIPQSGAATGKELTWILTEYLSAAAEGGGGSLSVTRALAELEQKKKKLNHDIKYLRDARLQHVQKLEIESELLQRERRQLQEELAREKELSEGAETARETGALKPAHTPESEQQTEKSASKLRCILYIVATILFAAMFAANTFWAVMADKWTTLSVAAECLLGISAAVFLGFAFRARKMGKRTGAESAIAGPDTAGDLACGGEAPEENRILAHIREQIEEKETRLYNLSEHREQAMRPDGKERRLQEELAAAELAAATIKQLAESFGEELRDALNSEVSRYVSAFTGGRYDCVRTDESGRLTVFTDGKEVPPEMLSRGTLEQFYLAFRIAVGNIVCAEEPLPIFLDEAFAMYDDDRLKRTLALLEKLGRQVLIFTCQDRERRLLDKMGLHYTRISLDEGKEMG